MLNLVWFGGALLLFGTCFANPQNPSVLMTSGGYPSNVLTLTVNTKKYVHTISDRFLSITLEPAAIFSAVQRNLGTISVNMARGLSPAYVRISGPECNYFKFQEGRDTSAPQSPSTINYPMKHGRNNITVTGWHWSQLNEFMAKTGLDLIVALNVLNRQQGMWDLGNTLDLISYSDKRGYNMAFQLGNDVQTVGSRVDGQSLGRDATRLRKVLEAFPRYANSEILGPDVKSCETQEEARYLKNFITESGPSLSAVTYQIPFSSEKHVENPTEMFNYVQNQMESRVWQKDILNKYLGKIAIKKPLWIVESGNKDRKGDFTDGLTWAQRLCAGARIGINTILRKPSLLSLSEPTPDYWVSVFHKALIGSEVLDIKISSGNKTRLETVAHCTKMSSYDPNEGILAPEFRYNRGAITVFGVNMGSENVKISLKTGEKQSLPLHQYFLTANNRQQNGKRATRSLSTMLNGQKLILSPDGELPIVSPKVRRSHQMITIPSQCVFFLVLPESKSKACTAVQIEEQKESHKNGGRVVDQEDFEDTDYDMPMSDQEDVEPTSNEKNNYVAFRSKYKKANDESKAWRNDGQKESKATSNEMPPRMNNDESQNNQQYLPQPESVIKYVTFSNNNWLSKFPKSLENQKYSVEPSTYLPIEVTTPEIPIERNVSPSQNRREKYLILAQAVTGKRYPEKNVRSDVNSNYDAPTMLYRPSQKLKLVKRSMDNDFNPKQVDDALEEFTNKESRPLNVNLKTDPPTSDIPFRLNDQLSTSFDSPSGEVTRYDFATPNVERSTQTTLRTTVTPDVSSTTASKHQHAKIECHVQKIKSRAEQALAKAHEKNFQKINGRKGKKESIVHDRPTADHSMTTAILPEATVSGRNDKAGSIDNGLAEILRYNRQTNGTITDGEPKTVRPRISLKWRKSNNENNVDPGNVNEPSVAAVGTTDVEHSGTGNQSKVLAPKTSKLAKPAKVTAGGGLLSLRNGLSASKENGETMTEHSAVAKLKPVAAVTARRLGRVKTSSNVNADQIATNGKIAEKLIEKGPLTEPERPIVSPVTAGGEADELGKGSDARASGSAAARFRSLEERIKARRSEMERKFRERFGHKVGRRSAVNDLLAEQDDAADVIDSPDRFGSNELSVDVEPVPIRERLAIRGPRSVADFTVKLNEVNTYVDKTAESAADNEIVTDFGPVGAAGAGWRGTNDIRSSVADAGDDVKSKRKSASRELDDGGNGDGDGYGKTATTLINRLFAQMQTLWKYIKRTLLF